MTGAVRCGRGSLIQRIGKCIKDFGWHGVSVDDIQNVSEEDLKGMMVSTAWQRVREEWKGQMDVKPKLSMLK